MGMPEAQRIGGDITRELAQTLHAGDQVLYSGIIYTARDAAHKRLVEALDAGEEPPISIDGAIIYYAGPAPAKPGYPIGPVGRLQATAWIRMPHACLTLANAR